MWRLMTCLALKEAVEAVHHDGLLTVPETRRCQRQGSRVRLEGALCQLRRLPLCCVRLPWHTLQ